MLKAMCSFGKSEKGFTLIELLIVVAIIAILAAIAIPQFSSYRKRGYNAASNSDLRNTRTTEEAMMADFAEYGASTVTIGAAGGAMSTTLTLSGGKSSTSNQTVSLSPGVSAIAKSSKNDGTARPDYIAVTGHTNGDNYYGADSNTTALYRKGYSTLALATDTPDAVDDDTTELTAALNWTQMQ